MRRLATRTQRDLLAIAQDFRCAICANELPDNFECDHIVPFSERGDTTLHNLQALCPPCHLLKSLGQASMQRLKLHQTQVGRN